MADGGDDLAGIVEGADEIERLVVAAQQNPG